MGLLADEHEKGAGGRCSKKFTVGGRVPQPGMRRFAKLPCEGSNSNRTNSKEGSSLKFQVSAGGHHSLSGRCLKLEPSLGVERLEFDHSRILHGKFI
jgi:hypothetical protein